MIPVGHDIAFNRAAAIAAGLVLTRGTNGSAADIAAAKANGDKPRYIRWLERVNTFVSVPTRDWCVTDIGNEEYIVVRADKWGSAYAPLTEWLSAHGINWHEGSWVSMSSTINKELTIRGEHENLKRAA